jgi:hypothetical protein
MIEFVNNNILFSVIFLILFFMNKSFHSRMSFDPDIIEYESTRERLQINRVGKCGGRLVPNRSIGLVSWVKPRGAALAYVTVYS